MATADSRRVLSGLCGMLGFALFGQGCVAQQTALPQAAASSSAPVMSRSALRLGSRLGRLLRMRHRSHFFACTNAAFSWAIFLSEPPSLSGWYLNASRR